MGYWVVFLSMALDTHTLHHSHSPISKTLVDIGIQEAWAGQGRLGACLLEMSSGHTFPNKYLSPPHVVLSLSFSLSQL